MIHICILFISLSWLTSIILLSFLRGNILLKDYQIKSIIESDRTNRYLGVYLFSNIIRNTPFKFLNLRLYFKGRSSEELIRVETEIKNAERGHLFAFYLVLIASAVFLIFENDRTTYLYINLSNIVFNGYPVLSLQLQKKRVIEILQRMNTSHNEI
jgi:hypothetical protein